MRDRTDAELTEYLAKLSAEFKAEGTFMDNTKKQLREDAMMLDVNDISDNIISRYKKLNMDVTVPNLNYFIDWDGDGIAGNEPDAGGDMTLTLDKKELSIPAEGGTFRIKIECKVPVTLERPAGIPDEPVFEESLKVFKYTDINYTKTIEGNELVIVARPADGALIKGESITVYTTSGKLSAELRITQNGDPSKQIEFEEGGQAVIAGIASQMMISMQDFSNLDGYYTQSFDGRNAPYHAIYEHTLTPRDNEILNIWRKAYNAISRIRMLDYILEKGGVVEAPSFMAYIHQ